MNPAKKMKQFQMMKEAVAIFMAQGEKIRRKKEMQAKFYSRQVENQRDNKLNEEMDRLFAKSQCMKQNFLTIDKNYENTF